MSEVKRRIFPEAFKREAAERVVSSGLRLSAIADELGVHATVLRKWVRRFGAAATGTPRRPHTQVAAPLPADQAAEVARLRRENDRLRMERDILKKAALIFGAPK